jgi:hypothetical protein
MSSKSNVVTVFQKMSFSENEVNCSVLTVFHIVKRKKAKLQFFSRFVFFKFRKRRRNCTLKSYDRFTNS